MSEEEIEEIKEEKVDGSSVDSLAARGSCSSSSSPRNHSHQYDDVTSARDVIPRFSDTSRSTSESLAIFSFISAERNAMQGISYRQTQQRLREAVAANLMLQGPGLLLDTREKGVLFPMVHFTDNRDVLRSRLHQAGSLLDGRVLGPEWVLNQGVYREVRNILPDRSPGYEGEEDDSSYILIGFKSLDRNFSQVMVDTWKDWTGARSIYFHLPDELGLSKISFYHRETPEDLQLFMYIVMVECRCTGTPEKVCRLLDFTQRLRVERMTGYISVYSPMQTSTLLSCVGSQVISPTVIKHGNTARQLLNHLTIFESRPRNSRSPSRPEV